ncbi:MAG: class I SAM-dependent methyltransferase [Victivallaceae bacterium]|jgi:hypothetical protein
MKTIYSQIGLPAFQNKTYVTPEEARKATVGDVELIQDLHTGLVHNHLFRPDILEYDESYQNEQAGSGIFRNHLQDVMSLVKKYFAHLNKGAEIGCGKGFFLEMLRRERLNITGFDPAYQGNSPYVIKEYYNGTLGYHADYVILRHVLEHIDDPFSFLQKISQDTNGNCYIYIEVPCFDWIIKNRAFYDIFYEHSNYFSAEILQECFTEVLDAGHLFGGQYLYIVANLSTFKYPQRQNVHVYSKLNILGQLNHIINETDFSLPTYIWGAGAKGATLVNLLFKRGIHVEAMIDINPKKQNRFIGLSAARIVSPDNAEKLEKANVIVMNPLYLDEIASLTKNLHPTIIEVTK